VQSPASLLIVAGCMTSLWGCGRLGFKLHPSSEDAGAGPDKANVGDARVPGSFDPSARDAGQGGVPDGSDTCRGSDPAFDADGDSWFDACDANPGDPRACADTDGDGCDDCSSGAYDPRADGDDADTDGLCVLADCHDGDPGVSSLCTKPTTQAELEAAVLDANKNPGHDFILLGDITVTDELPDFNDGASLTDGVTITAVPGTVITIDGALPVHLFESDDAHTHVLGLTIIAADYENGGSGNGHHLIRFKGDDSSAVGNTIKGFLHYAIRVQEADRAYLAGNTITGGTGDVQDNHAAIVLTDTADSVVVDNLVVRNNFDNIQIENARRLVFDRNTIADSASGAGIRFLGLASSRLCMRSNLVTHNATYGLDMTLTSTTWDGAGACVDALAAAMPEGHRYQNVWHANGTGATDDCCALAGACDSSCVLPVGRFGFAVATLYTNRDVDAKRGYCPSAVELVDTAAASDAPHDRNGSQPGRFNGAAPDIGAREAGFASCP